MDLTCAKQVQFWQVAIRSRRVAAMVGGPPCETFTAARFADLPTEPGDMCPARGPTPLRSRANLWGLDCLTPQQMRQVLVSNMLMFSTLLLFVECILADCMAIVKHPETRWC